MKPFKISPITKEPVVKFSKKNIQLPRDAQAKVDAYWEELISRGKTYKRGEVFTVTQKNISEDTINILVEKTDYAHYLYCQNIDGLGENGVCIIHTASLVETSDGYTIFGEMGHQTSRAGIHQLCGGGIDNDDLRDDYFDFTHNITKELLEELGIDVADQCRITYFSEAYFKEGGPTDKMAVVFRVVLNETKDIFLEKCSQFEESLKIHGKLPEFERIIAVKINTKDIEAFLNQENIVFDEYMRPLLEYVYCE